MRRKTILLNKRKLLLVCAWLGVAFAGKTAWDVTTPDLSQSLIANASERFGVVDRSGTPLSLSYQSRFNLQDVVALHDIPPFLQQAFVAAEDRHFFEHHGVDWSARLAALYQNIKARKSVRGASTISEQVVRIAHPRPRNMWSRWLEGFEAVLLEWRSSKGDILAFYMNQVPYAANRNGVAQAANYYFNRDLDTLNQKEMLALAVLPRAPSALDLYKNPATIEPAIRRLAESMEIEPSQCEAILAQTMALQPPDAPLNASHFIHFIRETTPYHLSDNGVLRTTLDAQLQRKAQKLLDERVKALAHKRVGNGAVLVADHTSGEILAWAVAGAGDSELQENTSGHQIDMVRSARQPGSALKPFLYAKALDQGWSAATLLNDAPMGEAIGAGLHAFRNYSHVFYGMVSLREALGNSLNIPALETIGFVKPERYLELLHRLGFASLAQSADFYKEGLALGNGEVTLFEMVQAYSALANKGVFRPLTALAQAPYARESTPVFSSESASLIANILSDPFARRREFGTASVLNLPVQTAVKTGTSTDYRDAWVLGFNARYTVGVWMGNVNLEPMDGITGSVGPALVLRGIFSELMTGDTPRALFLSPKLARQEVCTNVGEGQDCFPRSEYFIEGSKPEDSLPHEKDTGITLTRPTEGLQMAYDPRLPADKQAFEFTAGGVRPNHKVKWLLNGALINTTHQGHLLWPLVRGHYTLQAKEVDSADAVVASDLVHFHVK